MAALEGGASADESRFTMAGVNVFEKRRCKEQMTCDGHIVRLVHRRTSDPAANHRAYLRCSPCVLFCLASCDALESGVGDFVDVLLQGEGVDVLENLVAVVDSD